MERSLAEQLAESESQTARLKARIAIATCREIGEHDMKSIGGRNAACDAPDCQCSVPVHECSRCGECDYGDNAEATEVIMACALARAQNATVEKLTRSVFLFGAPVPPTDRPAREWWPRMIRTDLA